MDAIFSTEHRLILKNPNFFQILLAIGGWSGGSPTNAIEAFDPRAEVWLNASTLPGQQWLLLNLIKFNALFAIYVDFQNCVSNLLVLVEFF